MNPWLRRCRAAAAALALGGCGGEPPPDDGPERLRVVATVGMIADIARQVAGDRADVTGIIGEGVDPHLYKASRGDVAKLLRADLVLANGLLLEGKMGEALAAAASRGKLVVSVGEIALQRSAITPPHGAGGHADPHVWMDPQLWSQTPAVIAEALEKIDPEGAAGFAERAAVCAQELLALDRYIAGIMATIPADRRVLVTAHDAFGYFGARFGIEVRGIQGLSTESEAGVRDIETLVAFLVARRIPAVFVETSVSDKNVRALIEGCRAQGHDLRIGGSLYSDAMGAAGTYEGTYVGMLDANATTIVRALGGAAPAGGMQGRLSTRQD